MTHALSDCPEGEAVWALKREKRRFWVGSRERSKLYQSFVVFTGRKATMFFFFFYNEKKNNTACKTAALLYFFGQRAPLKVRLLLVRSGLVPDMSNDPYES